MPPPPPPDNDLDDSAGVLDSGLTSYSRTRRLLRSLEDLRDTLESRVNQLAESVERLRAQAQELEASMDGHRRSGAGGPDPEADVGDGYGSRGNEGTPRPIPVFVRSHQD